MPTTVAYITSLSKPSGAGTHAKTVMKELAGREGIDLYAVNTSQTGYPETFVHEGEHYPWVFPHDMKTALGDIDPDVVIVHVFNTHLFDALEELSADLDATWMYRHGTNLAEQWLSRSQGRPYPLSALKTVVWDLSWFDTIICPSQTVGDRMSLFYGDDVPELAVIPNAIQLDRYTPTTFRNTDTLKVVMATRLAPINYAPMPILAIRRLIEEFDISFRIYGGGHEQLETSIERLAGDTDDIEVMGHVDRPEVIRAMEQADIAVSPSFSQNAVPYSALEGLASGCLTLVSDCAAVREEDALVICAPEDPTTWYNALRDACEDTEDVKEFVREGLQAAREYDVGRIVDEGYLPVIGHD